MFLSGSLTIIKACGQEKNKEREDLEEKQVLFICLSDYNPEGPELRIHA